MIDEELVIGRAAGVLPGGGVERTARDQHAFLLLDRALDQGRGRKVPLNQAGGNDAKGLQAGSTDHRSDMPSRIVHS